MKKYLLISTLFMATFGFSQVTVDGICYLEGEADHSGTAVTFDAISGSAVTQTVYTEVSGAFTAGLTEGIYIVTYSKDGFVPVTLPGELEFFSDTELETLTLLYGEVLEISGTLGHLTTWTPNYQYRVIGDLTLESGDSLIIDPGVDILFMGEYEFFIYGTLLAMGEEENKITFTSGQPSKAPGDWKWLYFQYESSSNYVMSHCIVEYGGGGNSNANIKLSHSELLLQDCEIRYSLGSGIYLTSNSSLTVSNSSIHDNGANGISIVSGSTGKITGNDIYGNNRGISIVSGSTGEITGNDIHDNDNIGIYINDSSTGVITENDIHDNDSHGIFIYNDCTAEITGNDIHDNNDEGIYFYSNSNPTIINNIIWGNSGAINAGSTAEYIGYNCIWGDFAEGDGLPTAFGEIITVNANGDSSDTWLNIFMDPLFVDTGSGDYHLTENSPAIDAGHPDYTDPDGTISDIGLYYYNQAPVIEDIANITINEDSTSSIVLSAVSPQGSILIFSAYSDTADVFTSVIEDTLTLSATENWNGFSQVTLIVTDEVGLSDTTSFELIVNPVNDSPDNFLLLSPTNNTEIIITAENLDEIVEFSWEESFDVDGDELTYSFDGIEFFTFESVQDNQLSMTYAEMVELMNEQELDYISGEWTVAAEDEEYSVPASNGYFTLTIDATALSIDALNIPEEFALHNNYPNPFNPITTIRYDLPQESDVTLTIYDITGRMVKTLVNNPQQAGMKNVVWNATDVTSGIYIYRIQAGDFTQTRKMILLK